MMIIPGLFFLLLVLVLVDQPGRGRSGRLWPFVILALFAFPLLGSFGMMGFGAGNWMHGSGTWDWWGVLGSVVILAGLAVGGYYLLRRWEPEQTQEEQVLKLRLAKGEITAEEYDLLRAKLKG